MNIHRILVLLQAARDKRDDRAAFAALFGDELEHGFSRTALLRSVAIELELTAAHLRRLLAESGYLERTHRP